MSSDAVRVYPDLLKALTIPSDTTVENLELNKKICNPVEIRGKSSRVIIQVLVTVIVEWL